MWVFICMLSNDDKKLCHIFTNVIIIYSKHVMKWPYVNLVFSVVKTNGIVC